MEDHTPRKKIKPPITYKFSECNEQLPFFSSVNSTGRFALNTIAFPFTEGREGCGWLRQELFYLLLSSIHYA